MNTIEYVKCLLRASCDVQSLSARDKQRLFDEALAHSTEIQEVIVSPPIKEAVGKIIELQREVSKIALDGADSDKVAECLLLTAEIIDELRVALSGHTQ